MSLEIDDQGRLIGSVADIALFLGLTERRVRQLEKSSVTLRVARGLYDVQRSVAGYCRYLRDSAGDADRSSESKERARLVSSKADLTELEVKERTGVLIDAAAVRKQDFTLARILRNNLQSIPDRISALVAAEADAAACHRMIYDEVNASLEQIIETMGAEQVDDADLDINRRAAAEQLEAADVSQETPGETAS